jgi:predicted methyltransferase
MRKYLASGIAFNLIVFGMFVVYLANSGTGQLAQSVSSPTPTPNVLADKIDRPTSNPYKGDLARFDREKRAEKLQIERVMDILGITAGKNVADIGAGGGWFTVIAAKRTGDQGKVYAVDINEESKAFIENRAKNENLSNVEAIISATDDPMLPSESVDSVLILNTYHEISEPVILLKNLQTSLKKNALVGIIDRNGKGDDHGIDEEKVISEAKRAGFALKEKHYFVSAARMDYFLVFKRSRN